MRYKNVTIRNMEIGLWDQVVAMAKAKGEKVSKFVARMLREGLKKK